MSDNEAYDQNPVLLLKEIVGDAGKDVTGNLKFESLVKYHYKDNVDTEYLTIRIQLIGYNAYDISIDDGKKITAETHHTLFTEHYQKYSFDRSNNVFIINGSSPKMKGNYRVEFHLE